MPVQSRLANAIATPAVAPRRSSRTGGAGGATTPQGDSITPPRSQGGGSRTSTPVGGGDVHIMNVTANAPEALDEPDLNFTNLGALEKKLVSLEASNVAFQVTNYFTDLALDAIQYEIRTQRLETVFGSWRQLDRESMFNLLRDAFPKKEDHRSSVESQLANIKLRIAPHNSKSVFKAYQSVVALINRLDVTTAQMKAYVGQCFKTLAKSEAVTPKFLNWVTLTVRAADPQDVQDYMYALGECLKEAHKMTRLVTYEWGVATELHQNDVSGKHNDKGKGGSSGGGNAVGGGGQKRSFKETNGQASEPSKKARQDCDGCGRPNHVKAECALREHPDFNKSGSWAQSKSGKEWATKGFTTLPNRQTLSGAKINIELPRAAGPKKGDEVHTVLLTEDINADDTQVEGHTLKCGIYGGSESKKAYADVLVDTGALQSNYINSAVANWLTANGVEIKTEITGCLVCSPSGCQRTKQYAEFDFEILNITNNKNEKISIKAWLLPNCPYDLIIGRPTIASNKLLGKIELSSQKFKFTLSENYFSTQQNTKICGKDCCSKTKTDDKKSKPQKEKLKKQRNLREITPETLAEICDPNTTDQSAWERRKKPSKKEDPNALFLKEKVWENIVEELAHIARAKLGVKTPESTTDTELLEPALANARARGVTQTNMESTPMLGPNNPASTQLHALYLLEKEKYGAEGKQNPFVTVREPKEKYLDHIEDDDHIDYDKQPRPWEDEEIMTSPLDSVIFPADVDSAERENILQTLKKFEAVFSKDLSEKPADLIPMTIKVDENLWKTNKNRFPARQQSPIKNEEIKRQILIMLETGLIEPSLSSETSQVVLAMKPDGKWRFCIDYRNLNLATETIGWPIPNITQMLQRIGSNKPKYFAVMDLTSGFFQAPLHPDSAKYTTFTTFMGNFQWKRVPMGAKGSPS